MAPKKMGSQNLGVIYDDSLFPDPLLYTPKWYSLFKVGGLGSSVVGFLQSLTLQVSGVLCGLVLLG